MLWQRILTILIAAPPVLALVLWGPTWGVGLLISVLWIVGAWEWSGLMRLPTQGQRLGWVLLVVLVLGACHLWLQTPATLMPLLIVAAAWWIVAFRWIGLYPAGFKPDQSQRRMKGIVGLLVIVPSWPALIYLHASGPRGPETLIFFLLFVWAADIGAYIAGRTLGKRKLAVTVSPGKTWEGAFGGMFSALVIATFAAWWFGYPPIKWPAFAAICVTVFAVSVVGDLTQSMFKRQAKLDDSGGLFPGHGGVLDRVDSLMAAAPVFTLGLLLLGLPE